MSKMISPNIHKHTAFSSEFIVLSLLLFVQFCVPSIPFQYNVFGNHANLCTSPSGSSQQSAKPFDDQECQLYHDDKADYQYDCQRYQFLFFTIFFHKVLLYAIMPSRLSDPGSPLHFSITPFCFHLSPIAYILQNCYNFIVIS